MYCYCCSGKRFSNCCQPLLDGKVKAESGIELMRSRYSAYCHKAIDYLYATNYPDLRKANPKTQIAEFATAVHFIGLTITNITSSSDIDDYIAAHKSQVSFVASYINGNKLETLAEQSRFILTDQWYYSDGDIAATLPKTIGRNDKCPCGSGNKFKHCTLHMISGNSKHGPRHTLA